MNEEFAMWVDHPQEDTGLLADLSEAVSYETGKVLKGTGNLKAFDTLVNAYLFYRSKEAAQ